jgi:hypothetical protein
VHLREHIKENTKAKFQNSISFKGLRSPGLDPGQGYQQSPKAQLEIDIKGQKESYKVALNTIDTKTPKQLLKKKESGKSVAFWARISPKDIVYL